MVVFEILSFIIGIIYGYTGAGKENLGRLLRNGLLIGIVLAIILVVVGLFVSPVFFVLGAWTVSAAMLFIEVLILTVLFIIGTWIGDWLEKRSKAVRVTPAR